jgi:hypothetical protein
VSFRPRFVANASAIALFGVLGLTACTSNPSNRRVVEDMIDSLDITDDQKLCMNDVLEATSNDQLDQMAEQNNDLDFSQPDAVSIGTEQYQEWVANLSACVPEGEGASTGSTVASDTTEAGDSTEAPESTDAADTTESAGTTDAPETTEPVDTTEG